MTGLIPGKGGDLGLHQHVQTCCGTHPISNAVAAGGMFPRDKAGRA